MKRTPIIPDLSQIPAQFHPLLEGTAVYDSSCSPRAQVLYLETEGGLFLKSAPAGTLQTEADMTRFYHRLGLGAEVLSYHSSAQDWMLTRRVPGEDCLDSRYLSDPNRLAERQAEILHLLHSQSTAGCPVPELTARALAKARYNFENKLYDASLFPDNWGYTSPEEAWQVIEEMGHRLKTDTLIHGDFCLPNVMLDNWKLSGFIDVGNGGIGDQHMDLFWGSWSLGFNLKDAQYGTRFLDAYGRENYQPEMLRLIAAIEVFG